MYKLGYIWIGITWCIY
ncbi:hypothetical protein F383_05052 [Gossypium arboreum]|uniref:Uncharacterized protein n=1 Tax=Gossypium arboreum TaxID=29729 RepID=A0A0B0NBL6_GOSAR|nr:hypothetical protein F383_20257 [Gossypium arboreum]KHG26006.1 hypothetical protein F383_32180 [Gossypium arboreum]KHG28506.1 hypothetical protein F383_05052 [Gossypium arboreum]